MNPVATLCSPADKPVEGAVYLEKNSKLQFSSQHVLLVEGMKFSLPHRERRVWPSKCTEIKSVERNHAACASLPAPFVDLPFSLYPRAATVMTDRGNGHSLRHGT